MLTTHFLFRIAASIAAVGVATFLGGAPAIAQDVIKVGAPLPLTGPLSPEGLKQKRGYDLWAEAANAKGGIKAGGKTYKVEIVYADYASNTPRAVQSAERHDHRGQGQLPVRAVRLRRHQGGERRLREIRHPDDRADGVVGGGLRPELQVPVRHAHTQRHRVRADRQARDREEQEHQARRHPGAQRPVPAGGRAGVREGRQGAEARSRDVRALRHRHDGSFRRDHADARRASRLGVCVRLHQRSHPHPQADERPWPQAAGHHHDRGTRPIRNSPRPSVRSRRTSRACRGGIRRCATRARTCSARPRRSMRPGRRNTAARPTTSKRHPLRTARSCSWPSRAANSIDPKKVRDAIAALDAETFYGKVKFGAAGQINSLQPPVFQLQGGKPVVLWPAAIKQGEFKFSSP